MTCYIIGVEQDPAAWSNVHPLRPFTRVDTAVVDVGTRTEFGLSPEIFAQTLARLHACWAPGTPEVAGLASSRPGIVPYSGDCANVNHAQLIGLFLRALRTATAWP